MTFNIARDGEIIGEFPEKDIKRRVREGKIKTSDFLWRDGMTEWEPVRSHLDAERDNWFVKRAWIAAFVSSLCTFGITAVSVYGGNKSALWNCIDGVILIILGVLMAYKFRAAFIVILVYTLANMVANVMVGSSPVLMLFFAWFYFQGTRAAFRLHSKKA